MPSRPADRDRWLALGLLLAALALAYGVLVHPWWTVPMLEVEDRIDALQQRELRLRMQLQQAPQVQQRLAELQARQGAATPASCPSPTPSWPPPRWSSGWKRWCGGQPGQPQLRDHQPLAAAGGHARALRARDRAGAPALRQRRSWPRCCMRWKAARRACSSTTSTCWRSAVLRSRHRRAAQRRRAGCQLRPVRLPASRPPRR